MNVVLNAGEGKDEAFVDAATLSSTRLGGPNRTAACSGTAATIRFRGVPRLSQRRVC